MLINNALLLLFHECLCAEQPYWILYLGCHDSESEVRLEGEFQLQFPTGNWPLKSKY